MVEDKIQVPRFVEGKIYDMIEGWAAYIIIADSYKLQKRMLEPIKLRFTGEISTKEYNRHIREETIQDV